MRHLQKASLGGKPRLWDAGLTWIAGGVFARRIRRAMRRHELILYYQPKVDVATGETTSVEALVRWRRCGDSSIRAPAEFVPRVEETSVLSRFNDYVLAEAIGRAAIWRGDGTNLQVAVNIPLPCVRPELVETLRRLLEAHRLPTELLQLEITEGGIPPDRGFDRVAAMLADSVETLEEIREIGVTIALDDFGTAHSNLMRLVSLPVDALKIDRSLVIPMLDDEMRQDVVRSTIHLAHRAGLWVVAEGVETAEHMRLLGELGADCVQGYWLARPMPAEEVLGWLQRQTPSLSGSLCLPASAPRWRAIHRAIT